MSWHYVPTSANPADILSRGATPDELLKSHIWSTGPNFLQSQPDEWPNNMDFIVDLPDRRKAVLVANSLVDLSIQCKYHNSYNKMQRIFAYVYKFLHVKTAKFGAELASDDIEMGTRLLIKNIQLVHLAADYKTLKANKPLAACSKLHSLMPFLCPFGLIRVGGRLQHSTLNFDAQHPIILPKKHPFTTALVLHFHEKLLHAGSQCLLSSIRQKYWPLGGRKRVNSIISKCLRCFKLKPVLYQHVMGSLPADRVRPNKSFYTTGIDFCGPFYYKSEVRTRPPHKCYIAIFICFSTKASHLELVQDLSTAAFLAALRRFVAIRGKPKTIWSDNATNFVGAKNELRELKNLFMSQSHQKAVHQCSLNDGIDWKFIPPRSPHFGGLWEAAVKTAKHHFYRTVGLHILTFDELRTLVCQISAIMNSRPLCPITENPNDLDVLTPGHFLVGGPLITIAEPDTSNVSVNRLSRWQQVSQLQQTFWRTWSESYLTLLQERTKWRTKSNNIALGSLVVLKDENTPPLKWQLGRVTDVICGEDNIARVVMVRTNNGVIKRAVSKVAVLPIEDEVGATSSPTGGGCLD